MEIDFKVISSETSITEKEVVRGPGEGDAIGVADGAVGCILDGAVVLDVRHCGVAGVLDGLGAGREEEAEDGG